MYLEGSIRCIKTIFQNRNKNMKNEHIPKWKDFFGKIILAFLLPVLAYFIFDASGFSGWLLHKFPSPPLHFTDAFSKSPHINNMVYLIFHSGVTHIFACVSVDILYHAFGDLRCILFHKHKR